MKEKIIKEIQEWIKEYAILINNMDEQEIVSLNAWLENRKLISYCITQRSDESDTWLQCEYYSDNIGKTIIFDYDQVWNSDGETVELMADSVIALDNEVKSFESKISFGV